MTKRTWTARIKQACISAGTYRTYFDNVITTLAGILEQRDEVEKQYLKSGAHPIVKHTNKGGATNFVQNPMLALMNNLNASALTYWRDLGLTPAGLKKIDEKSMKKQKPNALAEALRELGS